MQVLFQAVTTSTAVKWRSEESGTSKRIINSKRQIWKKNFLKSSHWNFLVLRCFKCAPWLIQDQTHTHSYTHGCTHSRSTALSPACSYITATLIPFVMLLHGAGFVRHQFKHTGGLARGGGGGGGRVVQRWSATLQGSLERATGGGCTLSSVPPTSLSTLWVSFGSCRWCKHIVTESLTHMQVKSSIIVHHQEPVSQRDFRLQCWVLLVSLDSFPTNKEWPILSLRNLPPYSQSNWCHVSMVTWYFLIFSL